MPIHEPDEDDPMEATGVVLPGDTLEPMAETFVEEFMLLGYGDGEILALFHDRFYMAPHMVLRAKGEAWVKALIDRVRTGGVPQVRVTTTENPERFEV